MMKRLILFFLLSLFTTYSYCGWTSYNITFENKARQYKVYLPPALHSNAKVVVLLHGWGSSMNIFDDTSWPKISDTANIILIAPQGYPETFFFGVDSGVFNSGIIIHSSLLGDISVNADVNDIDFINALVDSVSLHNSIDTGRIYLSGISNGGLMVQRIASESPGLFAAAASISGTRSNELPPFQLTKIIPIAHFHGTDDHTAYWDGNVQLGPILTDISISVDSLIQFWIVKHNCSETPVIDIIGNPIAPKYIIHYSYKNSNGESKVELFKIINGEHSWYNFSNTANTFDIAYESWKFFNRTNEAGRSTGISQVNSSKSNYTIFPNPVTQTLNIKGDLKKSSIYIIDINGAVLFKTDNPQNRINIKGFTSGLYFLRIIDQDGTMSTLKFIKL